MSVVKIVIGIIIIVLSFGYLMRNRDKSLMDSLMEKRQAAVEKAEAQSEQEARKPDDASSPEEASTRN